MAHFEYIAMLSKRDWTSHSNLQVNCLLAPRRGVNLPGRGQAGAQHLAAKARETWNPLTSQFDALDRGSFVEWFLRIDK